MRGDIGGITRPGMSPAEPPRTGLRAARMQPMSANTGGWGPPCPVCGRPTGDIGAGQCPTCGLPAAAQAALVVARIGATLTDIARDRDELVATLRATVPAPATVPEAPPQWAAPPPPEPPAAPPIWQQPPAPARTPRRRLSPQQVLVGLGALLVVAAALAFVAVAWT